MVVYYKLLKMSGEVESYTLPVGSNELCFDSNAFIQPSFSADRFLQEHRGRASLETMRDDLGSYLKVLRSATLDLIDHEYADFVGLSSSLVGLDKAVGKIRDPLGQLREEVMTVKSSLEEAVKGIKMQLEVRRNLRERRVKLESSLQAVKCLEQLENLLEVEMQGSSGMNHKLSIAERAAAECNHLQFHLERCDSPNQLELRALSVRSKLMKLLEGMLLLAVTQAESDALHSGAGTLSRLLSACASLNEVQAVERLVGECIVGPALDAIVRAPSGKDGNRSGSLAEIYGKALNTVDQKLGRLLDLTAHGARNSNVEGFDFLVHSFWPQFVKKLELNLPSIYAPGNPDIFHQRFGETMEFLERLEKCCGSKAAIGRLRSQPSYQHFINSWNLPVYFQIRFQEIAGSLEAALPGPPYPSSGFDAGCVGELMGLRGSQPSHDGFWLLQTSACWECIVRCWDGNTFIPQIGHRFWKMNLQVIARYRQWGRDILEHQIQNVKPRDWGAATVAEVAEQPAAEAVSDSSVQLGHSSGPRALPGALLLPLCLHRDACQLAVRLEQTLLPMVTSALTTATRASGQNKGVSDILKRSLNDGLRALSDIAPLASRCLVHIVSQGSLPHLRQCRDIPRFYRRTNRVHPTCPRPYVSSALATPLRFQSIILASFSPPPAATTTSQHAAWVASDLLTHWMQEIFSEVTIQYHLGVSEVLTSVHKMEESLRRLKRIKGRVSADAVQTGESPATDDDDKIRAQLALDVHHFCKQVESTGVGKEQVKQLLELVELVDNAINKVSIKS
ncbi:conserved oligomeric Golgi complex subunit 2 [Hetaerina americana]|uniref:conserved oligomeric Golgi complex subunit 2 n=1 Tax=Hetaerina americana TaxID=62018 RepID=UPI003A7F2CFD